MPPPGYGQPPGGYGQPQSPFGPPGPSGAELGPARFFKSAAIGGAVGGVASAIPILKELNCCFCMLNMAGAALAIALYLKESPNEKLNNTDAALCGGMAGGVAGLTAVIVGFMFNMIAGTLIAGLYASLPPAVTARMGMMAGYGLLAIPLNVVVFGAFGALGGFLSMQVFFKDRAIPG